MSKVTGTNSVEATGALREQAEFLCTLLTEDELGGVTARRILDQVKALELILVAGERAKRQCEEVGQS